MYLCCDNVWCVIGVIKPCRDFSSIYSSVSEMQGFAVAGVFQHLTIQIIDDDGSASASWYLGGEGVALVSPRLWAAVPIGTGTLPLQLFLSIPYRPTPSLRVLRSKPFSSCAILQLWLQDIFCLFLMVLCNLSHCLCSILCLCVYSQARVGVFLFKLQHYEKQRKTLIFFSL